MKEETKKYINYKKDWIKTQIKNNMDRLNVQDQLIFLNQKLDELFDLGVLEENATICETIMNYREEQKKIEQDLDKLQQKLIKNASEIVESILKDL
jgi:predicted metal-dependent hydrolase